MRLDDGFFRHPKARAAGRDGRQLFLAGLCWASANLTDGMIPKLSLPLVAAEAEVRASVAEKLTAAGLWIDHGDRYEIHAYLERNRSREQVEAEREAATERQRRAREAKAAKPKTSRQVSRRDKERSHADSHGPVTLLETHTETDMENATRSPAAEAFSESAGRRVARLHWEASDPKPTLAGKFIALVKLCEHFCEANVPEPDLLNALGRTRAYTIDSITFALKEAKPNGKPTRVAESWAAIDRVLGQDHVQAIDVQGRLA